MQFNLFETINSIQELPRQGTSIDDIQLNMSYLNDEEQIFYLGYLINSYRINPNKQIILSELLDFLFLDNFTNDDETDWIILQYIYRKHPTYRNNHEWFNEHINIIESMKENNYSCFDVVVELINDFKNQDMNKVIKTDALMGSSITHTLEKANINYSEESEQHVHIITVPV